MPSPFLRHLPIGWRQLSRVPIVPPGFNAGSLEPVITFSVVACTADVRVALRAFGAKSMNVGHERSRSLGGPLWDGR